MISAAVAIPDVADDPAMGSLDAERSCGAVTTVTRVDVRVLSCDAKARATGGNRAIDDPGSRRRRPNRLFQRGGGAAGN